MLRAAPKNSAGPQQQDHQDRQKSNHALVGRSQHEQRQLFGEPDREPADDSAGHAAESADHRGGEYRKDRAEADQRIDRRVEPDQHPADAGEPHADADGEPRHPIRVDALGVGEHRIVGDRAHRLAGEGEREEEKQQRHRGHRDDDVFHLLRPHMQKAEMPVAPQRDRIIARASAEEEADRALDHQVDGDGGDRERERALAAQRAEPDMIARDAECTRADEGAKDRDPRWQAEPDVEHVAREGPDRHVRRDREIHEAQHRVDHRQADGGHRQHGTRHQAVQRKLEDFFKHQPRVEVAVTAPSPLEGEGDWGFNKEEG